MRNVRCLALLVLVSACGSSSTAGAPETPPPVESAASSGTEVEAESESVAPPARLPDSVTPLAYQLELTIDPAANGLIGRATIRVELSEATRTIWIHGKNLSVSSVHADDSTVGDWRQAQSEDGIARLVFEDELQPGEHRLQFEWTAPYDPALEGAYRVGSGEHAAVYTQFEPLAARKAFPSFDEPRFKTPYSIVIRARESLGAFANGPESATETVDGITRHDFAETEPLPTYLVAWVVGPMDVATGTIDEPSGEPLRGLVDETSSEVEPGIPPIPEVHREPIPLRGIAPRGRGAELAFAMEHTPRIVQALERYFGMPYPFAKLDIVAVPDFAAGAMENAGLVTFRDVYLLIGEDSPVWQKRAFAFVMAHELAHQWFGNLVTMEWWDDLWLNEAFASWMETTIVQEVFPEMEPELAELMVAFSAFDADQLATARQIRNPIESGHDIHNAFDAITYSKGASVLAMFEHFLGARVFQRGVRDYLVAHRRGNATSADLTSALQEASGQPVQDAMNTFLMQPGVPLIAMELSCEEGASPRIHLAQQRYLPVGSSASTEGRWQVPVCARYARGNELEERCVLLTESESELELEGACPGWIHPNADGTGYYRWSLPDEQLALLSSRPAQRALTVRDLMSIVDSVQASAAANRTSYRAALEALMPYSTRAERALAVAPMSLVSFADDYLLENDAQKTALQRFATRLYQRAYGRLGFHPRTAESGDTKRLRASVLDFLAHVARDPRVRREAARRGMAYIAGGEIHPDAVSPDLVPLCLSVAVQDGGGEVFDSLETLFASTDDALIRSQLLWAMSTVQAAELRARVLALSLDPRLRLNESTRPFRGQARDSTGRALVFSFIQEHYDALAARLGPEAAGDLPSAVSGLCTAEEADAVRSFFEPKMTETVGGPRNLAQAVETIRLCAARADAQRESAREFFGSAR